MADVLSKESRHRNMSAIRNRNTKIERCVRRMVYAGGFKYRTNVRDMPGRPDIVIRQYRAVIFVNGCFWHGHDCHLFKMPETDTEKWRNKFRRQIEVDKQNVNALIDLGYRVLIVWECSLRGKDRHTPSGLAERIEEWVLRGAGLGSIAALKSSNPGDTHKL